MRLLLLAVLGSVLVASNVSAQAESRWLIVPSSPGARHDWTDEAAERMRQALVEEEVGVWPRDVASQRFEQHASRPPTVLSQSELERWSTLSNAGVNELAEANYDDARQSLETALNISEEAIEELNRNPERARTVFDTCLYMVRAVLETESERRARSVARDCRRLVPRAEPSPYMHPPAVTDLLGEIDALQARQSGELRIASEPTGCPARLNGVLLGETPVAIGNLFPGEYRLQVECASAERGRVHLVTVGAGRASRVVDARFDRVVETRPALRLRYQNANEEQIHRESDARRVADEVSASTFVTLFMPKQNTLEIRRTDTRGSQTKAPAALVRIELDPERPARADFAAAARALVAGECTDFTSSTPIPLDCGREQPESAEPSAIDDWPSHRRPRGQFIAGITLASLGAVGLGTGYGLLVPRANQAESWALAVLDGADGRSHQQRWLDLGSGIIASATIGSAALVTAMPLVLPERHKTPWWAWVSGGVGLGLGAFAIAWGVTAEPEPSSSCSTTTTVYAVASACVKRGEETSLALLTGLTAAPLITMPLVYLLRPNRPKLEPQARIGRSGAYVGLRGRF